MPNKIKVTASDVTTLLLKRKNGMTNVQYREETENYLSKLTDDVISSSDPNYRDNRFPITRLSDLKDLRNLIHLYLPPFEKYEFAHEDQPTAQKIIRTVRKLYRITRGPSSQRITRESTGIRRVPVKNILAGGVDFQKTLYLALFTPCIVTGTSNKSLRGDLHIDLGPKIKVKSIYSPVKDLQNNARRIYKHRIRINSKYKSYIRILDIEMALTWPNRTIQHMQRRFLLHIWYKWVMNLKPGDIAVDAKQGEITVGTARDFRRHNLQKIPKDSSSRIEELISLVLPNHRRWTGNPGATLKNLQKIVKKHGPLPSDTLEPCAQPLPLHLYHKETWPLIRTLTPKH